MAVTLNELYQQVKRMPVTLVAGQAGVGRAVKWTHTVENQRIVDFLADGEIVFTTGMGLDADFDLMQLVEQVYRKGASGVIINTGCYIMEIPQKVLDFGDEHGFALLQCPWEVRMSDINRIFCLCISRDEQTFSDHELLMKNAMLCPTPDNEYLRVLTEKGYNPAQNYTVAVATFIALEQPDRLLQIFAKVNNKPLFCSAFIHQMQLFMVSHHGGSPVDLMLFQEVHSRINQALHSEERCCFAVGKTVPTLAQLHKSYITALQVANLAKGQENSWLHYDLLGMAKLACNVEERAELETFARETVQPLYEYDALHHSDLTATVRLYYANNFSVAKTAQAMFVHRNTVNYKLKKVEELLGVRLSDAYTCANLLMGFAAHDIVR